MAPATRAEEAEARIAALEQQLQALLATRTSQSPAPDQQAHQPRFPHPETFHGEFDGQQNTQKLARFISQLRDKLTVDYSNQTPEATKIAYAISRLDGLAWEHCNTERANINTVDNLINALQSQFGDPYEAFNSLKRLEKIHREIYESFNHFYTRFNVEATKTTLTDREKIDLLLKALPASHRANVLRSLPDHDDFTLADLVTVCRTEEHRAKRAAQYKADTLKPSSDFKPATTSALRPPSNVPVDPHSFKRGASLQPPDYSTTRNNAIGLGETDEESDNEGDWYNRPNSYDPFAAYC